jgi:hypothetical protein
MNRILVRLSICLATFLFVLSLTVEAQNRIRAGKAPNPTLVAGKSGVYVTFERLGKRTPLRNDENGEGVWLRLHNNMRYSISLCAFGITEKGEQQITYGKDTQIGVKYDVVLNPVALTEERPNIDVPTGYNTGSTCHLFRVKSGKSFIFAVPAEHLVKGLSIRIPYIYEWEDETINNPTHLVFFNSLNIPQKSL